jgi:hypothetical protein
MSKKTDVTTIQKRTAVGHDTETKRFMMVCIPAVNMIGNNLINQSESFGFMGVL